MSTDNNVGIENLRGVSEYDPAVRTSAYGNMDRGGMDGTNAYKGEEYFSDALYSISEKNSLLFGEGETCPLSENVSVI